MIKNLSIDYQALLNDSIIIILYYLSLCDRYQL